MLDAETPSITLVARQISLFMTARLLPKWHALITIMTIFECAPTRVLYKRKQKIEQLKLANLFQSAETCAYQAIQHYQQ